MAGNEDVAEVISCLELRGSPPHNHHGSYDKDDEYEEETTVLVGFVQKPEHPWSLSRHLFPSKAGGFPAWLDPKNLPQCEDILCGICQKPLQFLMQVYAPIEGKEDAFHRTLFVFMCPDMACLLKDQEHQLQASREKPCRSVKVFRCQLRRANEFYSKDPPKNSALDEPIAKGVPLCSWCGTWKGEKTCGGCKKARYCARHHQLEHWKSGHATTCKVQGAMEPKAACNKLWPEFEIVDEEESFDEEPSSSGNMAIIDSGKEDDISRQFEVVQPSLEQQHWASFQTHLARAPGQVLRYCRSQNAKPLWPRLDKRPLPTSIPACSACSGPRIFEFQVLPQLLYFFKVSNDPDALDWGTLAIYSCESSCTSSKAYMEEFVWVQSA